MQFDEKKIILLEEFFISHKTNFRQLIAMIYQKVYIARISLPGYGCLDSQLKLQTPAHGNKGGEVMISHLIHLIFIAPKKNLLFHTSITYTHPT